MVTAVLVPAGPEGAARRPGLGQAGQGEGVQEQVAEAEPPAQAARRLALAEMSRKRNASPPTGTRAATRTASCPRWTRARRAWAAPGAGWWVRAPRPGSSRSPGHLGGITRSLARRMRHSSRQERPAY